MSKPSKPAQRTVFTPLSIRQTLQLTTLVLVGLVVAIGYFVFLLLDGEQRQMGIESRKFQSMELAYELKQSSDDLTRFARTYAVTGKAEYEGYFQAIVAIRDGKQPHPKSFPHTYWDQVAAGVLSPDTGGERYSIEQRMIDLGLSAAERRKLREAKTESDDLIHLEDIAMHAVKGLYRDTEGHFTIRGEPDLAMARELLHGEQYHQAKARIMRPIEQFFTLLKGRTSRELDEVRRHNRDITRVITLLAAVTIGFLFYVLYLFRNRIILPLSRLETEAKIIEGGDYSHTVDLTSRDEVGAVALAFNAMAHSITTLLRSRNLILDNALVGIAQLEGRRFVWLNRQMSEMFGYRPEELIGGTAERLYSDLADFKRVGEEGPVAMARGDAYQGEYRFRRKDGGALWCMISGKAIDPDDLGQGSIYIVTDISQRKAAEQALERARTVAEAANHAKSAFLASVSHELRTPMNAILGMSNLALQTDLDAVQRSYIERSERAARRLLVIINDIIDFARLDSGKIEIECADFSVRELTAELADQLAAKAEEKRVELALRVDPGVPDILVGDPRRLRRILCNLGDNGVKFSNAGGSVEISVRAGDETEQGVLLHFRVRDSGIGMTEQQCSTLFRPFSQIDDSSGRRFGGIGLGLVICKKLSDLMGGDIRVRSEPGKGSRFDFTARFGKARGPLLPRPGAPGLGGREANAGPARDDERAETAGAVDRAALLPLLRELRGLIAGSNIAALDLAVQLEPLLDETAFAGRLRELLRALRGFDFDRAGGSLEALARVLEVEL